MSLTLVVQLSFITVWAATTAETQFHYLQDETGNMPGKLCGTSQKSGLARMFCASLAGSTTVNFSSSFLSRARFSKLTPAHPTGSCEED